MYGLNQTSLNYRWPSLKSTEVHYTYQFKCHFGIRNEYVSLAGGQEWSSMDQASAWWNFSGVFPRHSNSFNTSTENVLYSTKVQLGHFGGILVDWGQVLQQCMYSHIYSCGNFPSNVSQEPKVPANNDVVEVGVIATSLRTRIGALEQVQNLLKMERQFDRCKTLREDKQDMAIQGQTLFNETKTDCQILDKELEKFVFHMKQLQNEMESIEIQQDIMKIGRGMALSLSPLCILKNHKRIVGGLLS